MSSNVSNIKPKVSILTVTYNQQEYIRQALDGFVNQKTNFNFEVIVADDNSTDKTTEIVKEYEEKYPRIIKPIYGKKNVGAQKNFVKGLQSVRGKYLAICDGDDYWSDYNKLQDQADFMDSHEQYSICFHPVRVLFENQEEKEFIFPNRKNNFSTAELLKSNFIQTNSVMYRSKSYKNIPDDIMPLDWYLHIYHAQDGKIGFLDKVMSVYRKHPQGVWWQSYNNVDSLWIKYWDSYLRLHNCILDIYKNNVEYTNIIYSSMCKIVTTLSDIDARRHTKLVDSLVSNFPEDAGIAIKQLSLRIKDMNEKHTNEIFALDEHSKKQAKIIDHIQKEKVALKTENEYLKSKYLVKLENAVKNRIKSKVNRSNAGGED